MKRRNLVDVHLHTPHYSLTQTSTDLEYISDNFPAFFADTVLNRSYYVCEKLHHALYMNVIQVLENGTAEWLDYNALAGRFFQSLGIILTGITVSK